MIEHPLGTGPFARVFCQAYFDEAAMKENKTYFTAVNHKSVMQFALYLASQKFDLPLLPTFLHFMILNYLITVHLFLPVFQVKGSHSIHMLNIQIDTKSFEPVLQQQSVLLCKPYVHIIDSVRLLDTLEPY